jgi:hypothetical protein
MGILAKGTGYGVSPGGTSVPKPYAYVSPSALRRSPDPPRPSRRPYPARDHPLASGRRGRMAGEADPLAEHRLRAGGQLT